MATRPAWKGYLKLSLVTCAVELSNATSQSDKVSFRVLNRATGNTVKRQYVDSVTGKPVKDEDEVKGYETGDDEYLLVEDKEIEAVQIESSHTLSIDSFVEKASIQQIYLDTPYYLAPADKVSTEAFAVIREAMARKKMAGLARIVLYRRERPVVIEPLGEGLLLTTLRYQSTVRQPDAAFDEIPKVKIDADMVSLASDIIDRKKAKFDPSMFEDEYENALLALVKAKQAGRKAPASVAAPKPSNVVNLFDALKKSLAGAGGAAAPARRAHEAEDRSEEVRQGRDRHAQDAGARPQAQVRLIARHEGACALSRQAGFQADRRTVRPRGARQGGRRMGRRRRIRRPQTRRAAAALRPAPGAGRRAVELGRHARPQPRSRGEAPRRACRGSSAGLCRL
jgi:DNA end-binding protein Ku